MVDSTETTQIRTDGKDSGQVRCAGDSALVANRFSGVVKASRGDYNKRFEVI